MFFKLKESAKVGPIKYPEEIKVVAMYPTEVLISVKEMEGTTSLPQSVFQNCYEADESQSIEIATKDDAISLTQLIEEIESRLRILKECLTEEAPPLPLNDEIDMSKIFANL